MDPKGNGVSWNLNQSLIAVAGGGFSGKGLGEGTQAKLGYLPPTVAPNDFIFSVLAVVLIVILQQTGVIDLFTARGFAKAVYYLIAVIIVVYFLYVLIAGGLNGEERKKVSVIFFLVLGATMFWAGFEQAGSSLNLFADRYTNRVLGSWEVPASWYQSINSMFIIIFAPIFGWLWVNRRLTFSASMWKAQKCQYWNICLGKKLKLNYS